MTIRIYTSKHCGPCNKVERLVKEGRFNAEDEVELVDIETDEGFEAFAKEVLEREDGAVPSAYKDGKRCKVGFDEEGNLALECPTEAPHASEKD